MSVLLTLLSLGPHIRPHSYINKQCMHFHKSLFINMRIEANNNGVTFPEVGAFCLGSAKILIGLSITERHKKTDFMVTYIAMLKLS